MRVLLCKSLLLLFLTAATAFLGSPLAHGAGVGKMYVDSCGLENSWKSYGDSFWSTSANVFGFDASSGIPNTFSYVPFARGSSGDLSGTGWVAGVQPPYDGTFYSGSQSKNPDNWVSNNGDVNPRVKVQDSCTQSTSTVNNGYYQGAGLTTFPDRTTDSYQANGTSTQRYSVAKGAKMSRTAKAVGSSRITSMYLDGVAITNGEGWSTYLEDSGSSSVLSGASGKNVYFDRSNGSFYNSSGTLLSSPSNPYMNCRPRTAQYDSSSVASGAAFNSSSVRGAFYQCQGYLNMDASSGSSQSLYVWCSTSNTQWNSGGYVECKNSAWQIKTVNNPSTPLQFSGGVGSVSLAMECTADSTNSSCYTDSLRNRRCDSMYDPSTPTKLFSGSNCSWSAGIFEGKSRFTVADDSTPSVAKPQVETPGCLSRGQTWYSLACFRSKNNSLAATWGIDFDVIATHQLGIERTYVGVNKAPIGKTPITRVTSSNLGTDGKYTLTYTTASAHGLQQERNVQVEGMSSALGSSLPSSGVYDAYTSPYNRAFTVSGVPSATQFQVKTQYAAGLEVTGQVQTSSGVATFTVAGDQQSKFSPGSKVALTGYATSLCDYGSGATDCLVQSRIFWPGGAGTQVSVFCGYSCGSLISKQDEKGYIAGNVDASSARVEDESVGSNSYGATNTTGRQPGWGISSITPGSGGVLGRLLTLGTSSSNSLKAGDSVSVVGTSVFDGDYKVAIIWSSTSFSVYDSSHNQTGVTLNSKLAKNFINSTTSRVVKRNFISQIEPGKSGSSDATGKATITFGCASDNTSCDSSTGWNAYSAGVPVRIGGAGAYDGVYQIQSVPAVNKIVISTDTTSAPALGSSSIALETYQAGQASLGLACTNDTSSGVQSCYQPCARALDLGEQGRSAGYKDGDGSLNSYGSMLPCVGSLEAASYGGSAAAGTMLTGNHNVPVYKGGVLQSPWKADSSQSIYSGAESPTETFAASSAATVGVDDSAPVFSGSAGCATSTSGPTVTNPAGANSAYWNPSLRDGNGLIQTIKTSAQICDSLSGVERSEIHYQTCTPSGGESCSTDSSGWSPGLPSFDQDGKFTANKISSAAISNLVLGSGINFGGSIPTTFDLSITTSAPHGLQTGSKVSVGGLSSADIDSLSWWFTSAGSACVDYFDFSEKNIKNISSSNTFVVAISKEDGWCPRPNSTTQLSVKNAILYSSNTTLALPDSLWGTQMDGNTSNSRLSSNGGGCVSDMGLWPSDSKEVVSFPSGGASCDFKPDGLAEGSKVRFIAVARDAAKNVNVSPVGSVLTMDQSPSVYPAPGATSCSGANAPLSVTAAGGSDSKTGSVAGYWGSDSYPYIFLRAAACDAGSGIDRAEIHYELCLPNAQSCDQASSEWKAADLTQPISSSNAASIIGKQVGDTADNRLASSACFIDNSTTVPGRVDTFSSQCKFKASGLADGTKVRFKTVSLDGAGIYGVSAPSATMTIDNKAPDSLAVSSASSSCNTTGTPYGTNGSGQPKTGGVNGYWSASQSAWINLNGAACDDYSGVVEMEMHYQTCSSDCGAASVNWTPSVRPEIKAKADQDQYGGTSGARLSSYEECTRTVSNPASGSPALLPASKSLSASACRFLSTGLADGSKVRFVLVARDGAGNTSVSSSTDVQALTMDSTNPKTVAKDAESCSAVASPGVSIATDDAQNPKSSTGTAEGYWSPNISPDMVLSSAGCDASSGAARVEMRYQTCTTSCSNEANWSPAVSTASTSQIDDTPAGNKMLYTTTGCLIDNQTPSGGSVVKIPPGGSGCRFRTVGMEDGTKVRFALLVVDAAGNFDVSNPSTVFTIDGNAPSGSNLDVQKYNGGDSWTSINPESGSTRTWINSSKIRVAWSADGDVSGVVSAKVAYAPGTCSAPALETPAAGQYATFTEDRSQECRQGEHQVKLWAVDGAGNETNPENPSVFRFHYDSDPSVDSVGVSWPSISSLASDKRLQPQTDLTVSYDGNCTPGATSPSTYNTSNSFTICWRNPAISTSLLGERVAPISAVKFRVGGGAVQTVENVSSCLIQGADCKISTSDAAGLIAPSNGSHPVTVWLEDQAGNSSLQQSVSGVLKLFIDANCP